MSQFDLYETINTTLSEAKSNKGGQLYVLIGIQDNLSQDKIGGPFVDHPEEEEVALFSSFAEAKKYVKKYKLTKPDVRFGGETFPFRKKSLLGRYNSVEIREYKTPLPLPLDPK